MTSSVEFTGGAALPGQVGFIGAGTMGGPMVEHLLAAGVSVRLFARRAETRARFGGLGADLVKGVEDVGCPVVVLCLYSAADLRELVVETGFVGGLPTGAVVVNHTTVDVDTLDFTAAAIAAAGAELLDAPISGRAADVRAGRTSVLLGGSAAAVEQCAPVLRTYSAHLLPTGDLGSATKTKLVNNALFAANLSLAVDAVRLAADLGLGLEPQRLAQVIGHCSGASYALHQYELTEPAAITEGARPYLAKDVHAVHESAAALGVDTGLLGRTAADWMDT